MQIIPSSWGYIDDMVNEITKAMISCAKSSVGETIVSTTSKPWFTSQCHKLKSKINKIKKKFRKNRCDLLLQQLKRYQREYRSNHRKPAVAPP